MYTFIGYGRGTVPSPLKRCEESVGFAIDIRGGNTIAFGGTRLQEWPCFVFLNGIQ